MGNLNSDSVDENKGISNAFQVFNSSDDSEESTNYSFEIANDLVFSKDSINKNETENENLASLYTIAGSGTVKELKEHLSKCEDTSIIHQRNSKGHSALQYAVFHNRLDICLFLLENGCDAFIRVKNSGCTLLHLAAKNNFDEMFELLISYKGVTDLINSVDHQFFSPLHYVIENENMKIFSLIMNNKVKLNISQNISTTSYLHQSVRVGNTKMVEILMQKGIFVDEVDDNGWNAIMFSAKYYNENTIRQLEISELLVRNIHLQNRTKNERMTICHVCAMFGALDILKLIVDNFTYVNLNCEDCYGQTPLHISISYLKHDVVSFLVEKGASLEHRDKYKQLPLDIVRGTKHFDSVVQTVKVALSKRKRKKKNSRRLSLVSKLNINSFSRSLDYGGGAFEEEEDDRNVGIDNEIPDFGDGISKAEIFSSLSSTNPEKSILAPPNLSPPTLRKYMMSDYKI